MCVFVCMCECVHGYVCDLCLSTSKCIEHQFDDKKVPSSIPGYAQLLSVVGVS